MSSPDYKQHDPRGWCGDPKCGAALGRPTYAGESDYSGPLSLRKVRLDSGGYDCNGTYFGANLYGIGDVYWIASPDCEIDRMIRARNRADARAQALALYPNAKVRR